LGSLISLIFCVIKSRHPNDLGQIHSMPYCMRRIVTIAFLYSFNIFRQLFWSNEDAKPNRRVCVCVVCRDVGVGVQRVLLRYNDENQSSSRRLSSQYRLGAATTRHFPVDRRLGLEHHVGHGLRTARLSVLPISVK